MIAAALTALAQFGAVRLGGPVAFAAHCAAAGLAYLLFVNLTKRKLGAPLIAAVLFGAHPALAGVLADNDGRPEPMGVALGLLSGVLLARTPLQPRLLWPSLAAYAIALTFAPGVAPVPFLVAAAIVAYHGLEPSRLFTKRLLPRFAAFLVPLAGWVVWTLVEGLPGATGFDRVPQFALHVVAPFGATDVRSAAAGAGIVATLILVGLLRLRASPKRSWPLLAIGASLAAGALLTDLLGDHRSFLAALVFAALLFAEGVEELFFRFSAALAMPLLVLVYAALAVQSHLAAAR